MTDTRTLMFYRLASKIHTHFDHQRLLKKLKLLMKTILSRSHRLEIDDAMPCDENLVYKDSQNFVISLTRVVYADSRLKHTAGLIFVLRLKFWSLCSRTALHSCKGRSGDKALTSWGAVKLGRFQLLKNVQIWVLWMQQLLRFQC